MQDRIKVLKDIRDRIQKGIIITDIIMTLYVFWLIVTNTSSWIPGILFGFTPFGVWLLWEANKLFGFCLTQKLMLVHIVAVYMCCVYQAYIGFGDILYPMRWIMFISGVYLIFKILKVAYESKKLSC